MCRRVFVVEQQQAAETDDAPSIQIECADDRAARRRQTDEIKMIRTSRKALMPVVLARMEERHALSRDGVEGMRLIGFGTITSLTGQSEIVFITCTAPAFRDDVFSEMKLRGAKFRREAVLTVTIRALPDQSPQFGREALFSHVARA